MWDKAGKKFCWNCSAILPYRIIDEKDICSKCSKEIKPPEEKDEKIA